MDLGLAELGEITGESVRDIPHGLKLSIVTERRLREQRFDDCSKSRKERAYGLGWRLHRFPDGMVSEGRRVRTRLALTSVPVRSSECRLSWRLQISLLFTVATDSR